MTSVPLIISPLFNRTFKQNNKLKKELLTLPFLNHFNWVQLVSEFFVEMKIFFNYQKTRQEN